MQEIYKNNEKISRDRDLYFCGDIHGEYKFLIWNIVNRYKIHSSDIVICGDYGIGFSSKKYEDQLYNSYIDKKLKDNDIIIYVVRGNHDNPEWFDGNHDYSRLKFLKDHEIINISGYSIYPIGGGVSIDRDIRIKFNSKKERFGSSKRIWWEGEKIVKNFKLPTKVDIIVSHESPISFDPVSIRSNNISINIWDDIIDSREYLNYVFRNIVHKRWFFAHYHTSITGSLEGVLYKCLDINEFYKLNVL